MSTYYVPYRIKVERDGTPVYATGLSESMRVELEALSGQILTPSSIYYSGVFDTLYGTEKRAAIYKGHPLTNSIQDRITAAWLSVHPHYHNKKI